MKPNLPKPEKGIKNLEANVIRAYEAAIRSRHYDLTEEQEEFYAEVEHNNAEKVRAWMVTHKMIPAEDQHSFEADSIAAQTICDWFSIPDGYTWIFGNGQWC